ncbi:hypothetical protein DM01DRAFT_1334421 [Hesseltinella vesiculosa]|uniref:Uncharacterized protein n=1 Tax=Hesseltinella vesiculosa TaxID=101127 RepID=A0A1X2GLW4_9FUNG|nr:hypothetical protein DM01DRAFT_1334421 [Hesseltinella vesiculosa]
MALQRFQSIKNHKEKMVRALAYRMTFVRRQTHLWNPRNKPSSHALRSHERFIAVK